jgi:hypothetical protein
MFVRLVQSLAEGHYSSFATFSYRLKVILYAGILRAVIG